MSTEAQEKILVPVDEAASMWSMGKSTFWRAVKNGEAPKPVKVGGATRWRVSDLRNHHAEPEASQPTTP